MPRAHESNWLLTLKPRFKQFAERHQEATVVIHTLRVPKMLLPSFIHSPGLTLPWELAFSAALAASDLISAGACL